MNIVAAAEALWAQHTIHLDPEPQGERHGVVNASADGEALSFVAVGDSMIAGVALGLSEGLSVKETLKKASAISAAAALREETGFFVKEDMERIYPQVEIEEL